MTEDEIFPADPEALREKIDIARQARDAKDPRDLIARAIESGNTPSFGLTWGDCLERAEAVLEALNAVGFLNSKD